MLSKISQIGKDKYSVISFTCVNPPKKANTEKQKVENIIVVIRSWRLGEMGRCLSKGTIL